MDAKTCFRWIAVLPAALLGVIVANFLLHWVIYATLHSDAIRSSSDSAERMLLPFAAAVGFVWAGAFTAPSHRKTVAIVLLAVLAGAWTVYFLLRSS